ncbi:MAG: sodium/glutamate symporter [Bacteroidales bacterium]|nr:sodium/glutamate symporter [Bacteroidales bacterium]
MHHLVTLDMFQTAGVGVAALLLGIFFTRTIPFLKRFCIPAPVSGGLLVSLLTLASYGILGVEFSFDGTIKDICMMLFFTSVGFQSNMKALKQGGRPLVVMVLLVAVLIIMQNLISLGTAKALGIDSLVGMAAGSIPMCGGHGTSGGFSPVLEQMGLAGAQSITMACATFGLVAGSMIGGPLAELLIRKRHLAEESHSRDIVAGLEGSEASPESKEIKPQSGERSFRDYSKAVYLLVLAMAAGMCLSKLLALTGITFPTYFGSLIAACLIRNVTEPLSKGRDLLCMDKIVALGDICLSLFLGIAMSTLKLWELASLVLPLCVILLAQVVFIALYAYFVAFRSLGKDYDAAVLVSGLCGFGLGATPNAMANMSAVCLKYRYAVNPFIIVPVIGAMFVDIINTTVITVFLNLL